ncbi:glycosyltransferase involved in cell wall biosynthesis [Gillisia mitskevichiae]|uniref:Glycosyltransferase involved in cell wall biosynthesis n=1 Tax=Gillisia mitskevichiae TaxID=270921 RepID=A0A495PUP4_9FLAO|nr:glycosyltransferase family 4 protein [Gillisia mitskevichiae]RKS53947.1 glycosyltransferase involved in cell wall biosynthesis [Gillisia mitskevichiae]
MNKTNLIFSHPTGNANVRALADGFLENELLFKFYTCIALFETSAIYPLTTIGMFKDLRKRIYRTNLKPFTQSHYIKEILRLASEKTGYKKFTTHESGMFSVDKIYRDLDKYVSKRIQSANGVYAYEDGALQIFEKAKSTGISCFYDLPIGHWRAMREYLNVERERNPEWAETLINFRDSPRKLSRKDEELKLADQIFVASSFTANSLKLFPGKLAPVHVIPYGFPDVNNKRTYLKNYNRPIKVLFVGGLSQRKGISYLFEAIDKFRGQFELTIVGKKATDTCGILNSNLRKHTWIPSMDHTSILKLMQSMDLLVFPSLFEGFGMVITEAMSQGTPVITTERTCGPDFIKNGENGWLVKAGCLQDLETKLEQILIKPGILSSVGNEARITASQRPWSVYSNLLSITIKNILEKERV